MTRARDVANIDGLLTTTGDTYYASAAGTPARLGIGSTDQVLKVSGGVPVWATPAGGGKVLQVVQATQSTATTVASTTRTDTGLTASITPSSASSKILVMVSQPTTLFRFSDAIKGYVYLMRGSTDIVPSEQTPGFTFSGSSLAEVYTLWTYNYLDSPATTSSVTYKTQGRVSTTANSGVIYFQLQAANAPSTMILMEIGA